MSKAEHNSHLYMQRAIELAREAASVGEVPVGCVIVQDGIILAEGRNNRESSQLATGHAELLAIEAASRKLKSWRLCDADLYVTLEPCLMCAGAILQSRIKRLFFGAYDPKSGMAGSVFNVFDLPSNHKVEVNGGILQKECADLLRDFFIIRRNNCETEK
ncbi:MAG: tRNA adenosine(34) deaminase TadA [Eubacteriales bacterium]|nr:tRNA adenosine(34) deaminase TadA [Eubacteriales bacterium]MDD4323520.1 tRNA adenosine(34) deaminase TadA [Eubacteriales bacterium]MDD4541424.1 tRNA adenosine(34) deaminase TadA [Eubacteriales bacterium]